MLSGWHIEHFFYAKFKLCSIIALTKFLENILFFVKADMLDVILIEIFL